jgi:hypothetical protein
MSLLDKLRPSEETKRKARADVRAAGRAARDKTETAKRKARSDARRAERVARRKAAELKERAGERESERRPGDVDSPETMDEFFGRAGSAAELRSPMDATLDPSPSGPELELFASAGSSRKSDDRRESPDDSRGGLDPSFIVGDSSDSSDSDSSLGLSEDMIVGDSDDDGGFF